jgi:hypothetical protein
VRRYDPWKRNESVRLVREYLTCIDELKTINVILTKKLDFFERLKEDCDRFELEDAENGKTPDNPNGETSETRILFVTHILKEAVEHSHRLLDDLTESMNAVRLSLMQYPNIKLTADYLVAFPTSINRAERTCCYRR